MSTLRTASELTRPSEGKVVATQKSVCVGVCGVYVKGIDIGRHRTWFRVPRIEWDAVQIRFQPEITEEQQVLQEEIPSYLPIFAEIQAVKIIFFEERISSYPLN